MTSQNQNFHIGDILSIITGKIVSPNGIEGIQKLLIFMTNHEEKNQTRFFQMPHDATIENCKPYILEQFPQLAKITLLGIMPENYQAWLNEKIKKFGKELTVKKISS